MNGGTSARVARFTAAGAAALLLVDLFLDWQKSSIRVSGIVEVETMSAGWRGWGFVAGVLALTLVAVLLTNAGRPAVAATVGLCTFVATTTAVFTGDADVSGGPVVTVEDSTLWAAWLGLTLAAVAFLATLVPLRAQPETPRLALRTASAEEPPLPSRSAARARRVSERVRTARARR